MPRAIKQKSPASKQLCQIFDTKISFQARDKSESIRILGIPGAENLKPCGKAIFYQKDTFPTKITVPFISDNEIKIFVEKLHR